LAAADFVGRDLDRVAGGGLAVCALDTELLGYWWHEGPQWLEAVLDAAGRDGLEIVALDDALAGADPAPPLAIDPGDATTWGTPRDLATWSAPPAAPLAWAARVAELLVASAGPAAPDRALRELLLLQASDWAFLETRALAGPYPRERASAHRAALEAALAGGGDGEDAVRNLAPDLCRAAFLEP
jgi:1,4-alpha-glucan branching enzyme